MTVTTITEEFIIYAAKEYNNLEDEHKKRLKEKIPSSRSIYFYIGVFIASSIYTEFLYKDGFNCPRLLYPISQLNRRVCYVVNNMSQ